MNDFAAPATSEPSVESPQVPVRPTSWLVLGIIGICMGGLKILGGLFGLIAIVAMPFFLEFVRKADPKQVHEMESAMQLATHPVIIGLTVLGLVIGIALLVVSIGLVRFRGWSRPAARLYALIDLPVNIATALFTAIFTIQIAGAAAGLSPSEAQTHTITTWVTQGIGMLFGCALPICFLVLLRRDPRLHPDSAVAGTGHDGDAENPYRSPSE